MTPYEQHPSGLVLPKDKPDRPPVELRTFEVYHYSDLVKLLQLIAHDRARFISAASNMKWGGIFGGYVVTYEHWENLNMEVKT